MRVPSWMICGLLVSILIMDIASVWTVRNKIVRAADMALDAALTGGLIEYDAKEGKSIIDEDKGYNLAVSCFKKNMKLNNRLENQFLTGTSFDLEFDQDGEKPRAILQLKTSIKALSPMVVGIKGIPVAIRKTQYHVSTYK